MSGKARGKGEWTGPFLAALAETGVIGRAARKAGIVPGTATDRRRRYPDFDQACKDAIARHGAACGEPPPFRTRPPSGQAVVRGPKWCTPFLAALAETSNVAMSAGRANVPLANAYRLRRTNPAFAARWRAALYEGYEHLEMEVLAYLRGYDPGRKFDVASAIRLLAAHRQTVAEIRAMEDEEDEQAVLESIDRFIDDMRERRAANAAILIEAEARDAVE